MSVNRVRSKVWFVTGSSRGLGRAVVEAALEAGDRVLATARKPEQIDNLVSRYGERVKAVALDVTDPAQAHRAVRDAVDSFGRLDVVVNNAGYGDIAAVEDVTLADFRRQIDTDFYGVVHVSKAVVPILRQQGSGHIFQVSSISSRLGGVGLAAYQSAKWAVSGFSITLAREVAPFGVKVTVLEPGGMKTDWGGSSMTIPPISEPYQPTVGAFAQMVREISGHEENVPERVAQVVVDLAGRDDPPLRLVLGAQALQDVQAAAQQLAASDEQWRSVTESTVA
jgi:NAD(P)-dependent dehydrogenase (short-subunit alcohol dehydrogenase family)